VKRRDILTQTFKNKNQLNKSMSKNVLVRIGVLFVDTKKQQILLHKKKEEDMWSPFIHELEFGEEVSQCVKQSLFTTIGFKVSSDTEVSFLGYDELLGKEHVIILWHSVKTSVKLYQSLDGYEAKWFSLRLLPVLREEVRRTIEQSKALMIMH